MRRISAKLARSLAVWSVLGAIVVAPPLVAQNQPAPVSEWAVPNVEDLVQAHHDAGMFEGVILVAEKDRILFHRAYGLANREWKIPTNLDTRFHLGSVGKQMTGAIILQLMEEGKIDLDQSIIDILPDYPELHGHTVKVRHLLNHTSGIPNYTATPQFATQSGKPATRETILSLFQDKPLNFEPGDGFSYTNSGFFLLSVMIETIEERAYGDVLQDRLLTPLGLKDTGYIRSQGVVERMAQAYVFDGVEFEPEGHTDESWIVGNAMIYSTARDLLRWTDALFDGRPFRSQSTRHFMLELPEGQERNYSAGIGNVPITLNGMAYRGVGHSGALGGFRSTQNRAAEPAWTVIVLSNVGIDQNDLADRVLRVLAGETVTPPKRPLSLDLLDKVQASTPEEVTSWFVDRISSESGRDALDERSLERLAFALLDRGRSEEALFVLRLNAQALPKSARARAALGTAYAELGRMDQAQANLEEALEIDPQDETAKSAMQAIQRP